MPCLNKAVYFTLLFFLVIPPLRADDQTAAIGKETQASVIQEKIKKEFSPENKNNNAEVIITDETGKEKKSEVGSGGPRFYIKKIILTGSLVFSPDHFKKITSQYENKEITFKDLSDAADKITQEYRTAGYLTSTAYIPEQKITDAKAKITIVEGKVGRYQVESNRYFRKKQLIRYMRQEPGKIFKYPKLREGLAGINQNPDREVRSILKKGQTPETTDIILRVKDHLPIHANALFDNQGSRSTGQKRYGLTLRTSNTTGLDDSLAVGTIFGLHFGSVFTRYEIPVSPKYGTTLFSSFSHVQVEPKKELKDFGVNGTSENYSTGLHQPLFNNRLFSLDTETSFDFKESRTKVLSGTFRRERLRILRFTHSLTARDRFGATFWEQNYGFGFDGLGASIFGDPSSARQGVEPDFFKWYGSVSRRINLFSETYLQLKTTYQLSSKKLSSSEGLYMGGASTVRGYGEGDYIADRGIYTNIEYLTPAFFIPSDLRVPYLNSPLRDQIETVTFFDYGYGRLRGPSESEVHSRHLAGLGAGLRIHIFKNIYSRLEWAAAVGDKPLSGSGSSEFHFRVQAEV